MNLKDCTTLRTITENETKGQHVVMTEITIQSLITRSDEIVAGKVEDRLAAMSIETGKYYMLNTTGGRIWELLEEPRTVAELCASLTAEFKITPEACRKEVIDFLTQLVLREMVVVSSQN